MIILWAAIESISLLQYIFTVHFRSLYNLLDTPPLQKPKKYHILSQRYQTRMCVLSVKLINVCACVCKRILNFSSQKSPELNLSYYCTSITMPQKDEPHHVIVRLPFQRPEDFEEPPLVGVFRYCQFALNHGANPLYR